MLRWNQLNQQLETTAQRHLQLKAKFDQFAHFVEARINDPTYHIKGISTELDLDQGCFVIFFAGRKLQFVFASLRSENGSLVGVVKCILLQQQADNSHIPVGEFTFVASGKTNLIEPEDGDSIIIDDDIPALYIALHFIHESLSK